MMTLFRKIIPLVTFLMLLSMIGMAAPVSAGDNRSTGKPGTANAVSRDIKITQVDNLFLPNEIRVAKNETVRIIVVNKGDHQHEMLIGTMKDLRKTAQMRRKYPDAPLAEPGMIRLQPDEQDEIIWMFDQPGEIDFACPLPGHFKVMRGKIYVEKE